MGFTFPWPKKVLMVSPDHFRVDYAINPYMRDEQGNLHSIDQGRARQQWENLRATFMNLGLSVEVLPGQPDFPDMVFCANQCLPFVDKLDHPQLILSRLASPQRRGEVRFFREWAEERCLKPLAVTDFDFEGGGDAIWNYEKREIWGGYGQRTKLAALDQVEKFCGWKMHRLKIIDPQYYHLDIAFAVLRADVAAYVPAAFDAASCELLKTRFRELIEIDAHEARHHFAANCVSVDGKNVIVQKGANLFMAKLKQVGFMPIEVETSEFMKAGGSAFCLKQILF